MKPDRFDLDDAISLGRIPESCGLVTIGCSQVAGIVEEVLKSSEALRADHRTLQGNFAELEADQDRVAQASDEARQLSERAMLRLNEGTHLIHSSLGRIHSVLELVDTLVEKVTGFAAAMEQVRRSSKDIEQIAETTNILALNATIEAMRAGEAGRTFAVVAGEVKNLAGETRKATDEIAQTIEALDEEAKLVIDRIRTGSQASGEAKASISEIERTISSVGALVEEVDKQNDQIARSTTTISGHIDRVQTVLGRFDLAAIENEGQLEDVHFRMGELEGTANDMLDLLVKTGLSPVDSDMVAVAQEFANRLAEATDQALGSGELTEGQLFDQTYREIAGSNPPRFRTALSEWADANWRPILDECLARGRPIKMLAASDMQGFLPTHVSERSRVPTGDLVHDTAYCRNGRIIFGPSEKRARASSEPYLMSAHRQENAAGGFYVVRTVYIPLVLAGKRWGDVELAYILEDAAWPKL